VLSLSFGLLWAAELIDWLLPGQPLNAFGIRPRQLIGLLGIPLAPFLHDGWAHLIANSAPFLLLGWFVILRGTHEFIEVSVVIIILGGFGTWLIGKSDSVHIGASLLIFGYFGFLMLRGMIEFSLPSLLIAIIVGFLYGGLIWGVLPSQASVSWEGHLCGFLAGLFCARTVVRERRRGKGR